MLSTVGTESTEVQIRLYITAHCTFTVLCTPLSYMFRIVPLLYYVPSQLLV